MDVTESIECSFLLQLLGPVQYNILDFELIINHKTKMRKKNRIVDHMSGKVWHWHATMEGEESHGHCATLI